MELLLIVEASIVPVKAETLAPQNQFTTKRYQPSPIARLLLFIPMQFRKRLSNVLIIATRNPAPAGPADIDKEYSERRRCHLFRRNKAGVETKPFLFGNNILAQQTVRQDAPNK